MKSMAIILTVFTAIQLSAQEAVLLRDIATNGDDAFTYDAEIEGITVNNQLFFIIDDGKHGEELWRSNGSTVGTQLIKDVNPGPDLGATSILGALEDMVFFRGSDGVNGSELWVTRGTASSTQMIEINPGSLSSNPYTAVVFDDMLIFPATGEDGTELYRTEGTAATTALIRDIYPDPPDATFPRSSSPSSLYVIGNEVLFWARDQDHGKELWKTDGTFGGTVLVSDIIPGANSGNVRSSYPGEDKLYFTIDDGVHGLELWCSDGTNGGTFMVKDITAGEADSDIEIMEEVNGTLYFIVEETVINKYLWRTDGTEEGTQMVGSGIRAREFILYGDKLVFKGDNNVWMADGETEAELFDVTPSGEFGIAGNELYFSSSEGLGGQGLWKINEALDSVSLVKEVTQRSYRYISYMQGVGDKLYFIAETDTFGNEIWASDGTAEGTMMLVDAAPGEDDGFRSYADVSYGVLNDMLLFAGFDSIHGRELWSSKGTPESTELLKDINSSSRDVGLFSEPVVLGESEYFITRDKLWKSDGSAENTVLVRELENADGLNVFNGKLLFTAEGEIYRTIWESDGTAEGTRPLPGIEETIPASVFFLENMPQLNGTLFFTGNSNEHGRELWKTDGTAEGTSLVKDINEGPEDSGYGIEDHRYIIFDNQLYFLAFDGISGYEIWKTDGTEAGTVPVTDINPTGSCNCQYFIALNDHFYFVADDGTSGRELWKSDGTTEGTMQVKDIYPGEDNGLSNRPLAVFKDQLFFAGANQEFRTELWKSDGTAEGTVMVKDIFTERNNINRNSNPENFLPTSDYLYFTANDSTGEKFWRTDGTEAGTEKVLELEADFYSEIIMAAGKFLFAANDEDHGFEMWRADTNMSNPVRMTDIAPGVFNADPRMIGFLNGSLYFTAEDEDHGREIWTLTPFTPEVGIDMTGGELCSEEDTAGFSALVSEAGPDYSLQWLVNGEVQSGAIAEQYSASGFADGDEVSVQLAVSDNVWATSYSVFSDIFEISFETPDASLTLNGNILTASEGDSYRWFLNDELLDEEGQTLEVLESGTYRVEVTNEQGCSALSDPIAVVVNINSIENHSLSAEIDLYPIPASDILHIRNRSDQDLEIELVSLEGKLFFRAMSYANGSVLELSLDDLSEGIYLVRLISDTTVETVKLTRQ